MNQSAPLDANPLELIACHECDTLHRIPALAPGRSARCSCCGALLVHNPKGGLERPIALNIAALILLILANAFPFLTLQISGREQTTTIIGASRALYEAGMGPLAVVVIITTVIGPTLVITSSLYVLLGVRLGVALPMLRSTLSWISHLQPWGMLDVFMLGVLVSNPALLDPDSELIEYERHKAVLTTLEGSPSQLQVLLHGKHLFDVQIYGLAEEQVFALLDQAAIDRLAAALER